MAENKVEKRKEEPGAARFGNFICYYNFHPPEERTKLLPYDSLIRLFASAQRPDEDLAMLDVGCNTGDLTRDVHKTIENLSSRKCHSLAVDVDPILIQRAREADPSADMSGISYEAVDVKSPAFQSIVKDFLLQHGKNQFDISFLFSVTMWIHLNSGDSGLEQFLVDIASKSRTIVLEPQTWKCYRSAARRLKRFSAESFEFFDKLVWRSDVEAQIDRILTSVCGFEKLTETSRTSWGRKLSVFHKSTLCIGL